MLEKLEKIRVSFKSFYWELNFELIIDLFKTISEIHNLISLHFEVISCAIGWPYIKRMINYLPNFKKLKKLKSLNIPLSKRTAPYFIHKLKSITNLESITLFLNTLLDTLEDEPSDNNNEDILDSITEMIMDLKKIERV